MTPALTEKLQQTGVIAVIVIDDAENALPLADALLEGGVDAIELTLRTPPALEAASIIKKQVPDMTLGIGTVLTADQVRASVDTGADFAVSPGCNPRIISTARKCGLSFAPGIATPSDIEVAVENHCRILKFFPAEPSGGLPYLSSMAAPYAHLELSFVPLGGLHAGNAADYLKSPLITALGGSWIASRSLIQAKDWESITRNAREIRKLVDEIKT